MAAKWIYSVDAKGVRVTLEFMARLQSGDKAALRALSKQDFTKLYLAGFTREPRRIDAHGLFWTDIPATELIPLVKAGRHRPAPWMKDGYAVIDESSSARRLKQSLSVVRAFRKGLPPDQTIFTEINGYNLKAWYMKANPQFELVVVNKHDRAALLKLLSELDSAANVDDWLAARTQRNGATAPSVLYADYEAWCARKGEAAVGIKSFAQALVAAGIAKLPRSAGGARYELELL